MFRVSVIQIYLIFSRGKFSICVRGTCGRQSRGLLAVGEFVGGLILEGFKCHWGYKAGCRLADWVRSRLPTIVWYSLWHGHVLFRYSIWRKTLWGDWTLRVDSYASWSVLPPRRRWTATVPAPSCGPSCKHTTTEILVQDKAEKLWILPLGALLAQTDDSGVLIW